MKIIANQISTSKQKKTLNITATSIFVLFWKCMSKHTSQKFQLHVVIFVIFLLILCYNSYHFYFIILFKIELFD